MAKGINANLRFFSYRISFRTLDQKNIIDKILTGSMAAVSLLPKARSVVAAAQRKRMLCFLFPPLCVP